MKKLPVILACFFAACAAPEQAANNATVPQEAAPKEDASTAATSAPSGPVIGMANPASVYCTQIGGKLDMVNNTGICTLPNGEKIEEWALYRRDHH